MPGRPYISTSTPMSFVVRSPFLPKSIMKAMPVIEEGASMGRKAMKRKNFLNLISVYSME